MIMFDSKSVISPTAFKEVLSAGGIKSAAVRFADKGLILVLRIGEQERVLGQYRGGPRYFRTVDGAASVLIQHGLFKFEADVSGWLPRSLAGKSDELSGGTGNES
ncbi:partition protein (plasmid) [Advenella sp. S44]|uniref:ParC family partition-associated protein n=1 Tax=Advenella sp. S44 TaxID=1982755 RepID=UPI000C29ACA0|nr:ParC family partition-associated protein [Advenella sp. S44]PJX19989.1 partition protein [Advenella sp. S44]